MSSAQALYFRATPDELACGTYKPPRLAHYDGPSVQLGGPMAQQPWHDALHDPCTLPSSSTLRFPVPRRGPPSDVLP